MKCVEQQITGEPTGVLQYVERPKPTAGPGQVLVRMLASPVNPSDLMFIRGTYGTQPQLPQVPGFEGVGIVEASGGGLRGKFFVGKRVAVLNKAGGNWAEYAVVPANQVIPLSSQLTVEQAATFFVNPATAWIMTQEVLRVARGEFLVQTAAASSLGKMIVRLGAALGFETINIVRSQASAESLHRIGARHVIVFDSAKEAADVLNNQVAQLTGGRPLKYAIDPVGGTTAACVLSLLGMGGRMIVFGTLSDEQLQFSPRTLMVNQASVEGFWLGNFMNSKSLFFKLRLVKRLTKLIRNGTLSTDIAASFELDQISEAIASAESNRHQGKTLLRISE